MSLLNVERIKLTSTRSPWWCVAAALVLTLGLTALIAGLSDTTGPNGETIPVSVVTAVGAAAQLGLPVMMIMATLAVTTEYRFGIIRTSFQATPSRAAVVLAKAALLAAVNAVVGLVLAFGSVFLFAALSGAELSISTADEWRQSAGLGLVYALAAVLAVAVGFLLRQSAGAIALLLLFPLVIEGLISIIPSVGSDLYRFMPFANATSFLSEGDNPDLFSPWVSLGYFAAVVAAVTALAVVVVNRRDA